MQLENALALSSRQKNPPGAASHGKSDRDQNAETSCELAKGGFLKENQSLRELGLIDLETSYPREEGIHDGDRYFFIG